MFSWDEEYLWKENHASMGWVMQVPKSKILPSIIPDIWKHMLPKIIEEEYSEKYFEQKPKKCSK